MRRSLALALLASGCAKTVSPVDAGPPPEPPPLERCLASIPDAGEPDWAVVGTACERAAQLHDTEAIRWAGKARRESTAMQLLVWGERLHKEGKDQDAVKELSKIPPASYTYPRAVPLLKQLVDANLARAKEECVAALATPRPNLLGCEEYFLSRCYLVAPSELSPPPGKKLVLEGKLGKDGWRPADALFVDFLLAYRKQNPGGPPWACAGGGGAGICSLSPEAFRAAHPGDDEEALLAYCSEGPDALEAWRYARPAMFADAGEVQRRLDAAALALRSAPLAPALEWYRSALELDAKLLHREGDLGARGWVMLTAGQTLAGGLKSCDEADEALAWAVDEPMKRSIARRREALHCKP